MRSGLLVALLGLACGCTKPMSTPPSRDAQAPLPEDAAAADVADLAPASDLGFDSFTPSDAWPSSHDATGPELSTGCTTLPVTELPGLSSIVCPPAATDACGSQDNGPIFVARSSDCLASWGAVPFQCQSWPQMRPGQEFVIVPVPSCADRIAVDSAQLCDDRIEIRFINQGLCACGDETANLRLFAIPLDPRPVIATVTYAPRPPCVLP